MNCGVSVIYIIHHTQHRKLHTTEVIKNVHLPCTHRKGLWGGGLQAYLLSCLIFAVDGHGGQSHASTFVPPGTELPYLLN